MKRVRKKDGSVSKSFKSWRCELHSRDGESVVSRKSGCAPLTFLKEDGSPQSLQRTQSEIKCYYQVFMYTFDSREQSGRNCQVDDSDILVFEPNRSRPVMKATRVPRWNVCELHWKRLKQYVLTRCSLWGGTDDSIVSMRDRLEVSCFRTIKWLRRKTQNCAKKHSVKRRSVGYLVFVRKFKESLAILAVLGHSSGAMKM